MKVRLARKISKTFTAHRCYGHYYMPYTSVQLRRSFRIVTRCPSSRAWLFNIKFLR